MSSSNKVITNFLWRFLERVGAQGVEFVVSIVLARLLAPELFGMIAMMMVFISIMSVFIDSGLGSALIQKKEADDLDFSTVFWFNLVVCIAIYGLMFVATPGIAKFYKMPELVAPLRVISLTLVVSGVKNVQMSYVSRTMQFKLFFFATLGGTIGAAVLGIWLAYKGYGIWALVAQSLFNNTVDTIILWIAVKWRPKLVFSLQRLKALFSYGWKLLASALLDTIFNKLRDLIIGKIYTPASLAFYTKGNSFPNVIVTNINSSINSVLFPVMSLAQDDKEVVKNMTRKAITVSSYIMWPMMMGLAACAESLVKLLLTDKWLPCVPFLRIFCITYAFYPIHTANLNALKAMGRSDLFLRMEIWKKIVGMVLLLSTMWFGVMAMAYSLLISSVLCQIINSWPNQSLLGYSYGQQLKDIFPSLLLSAAMFFVVWSVQLLHLSVVPTLLVQIPMGALIYITGSKLLKLESYDYLLETAKGFLKVKDE